MAAEAKAASEASSSSPGTGTHISDVGGNNCSTASTNNVNYRNIVNKPVVKQTDSVQHNDLSNTSASTHKGIQEID